MKTLHLSLTLFLLVSAGILLGKVTHQNHVITGLQTETATLRAALPTTPVVALQLAIDLSPSDELKTNLGVVWATHALGNDLALTALLQRWAAKQLEILQENALDTPAP